MSKVLWSVTLGNVTCGVITHNGMIVESAPVLKTWCNQSVWKLRKWLSKSGGTITEVSTLKGK